MTTAEFYVYIALNTFAIVAILGMVWTHSNPESRFTNLFDPGLVAFTVIMVLVANLLGGLRTFDPAPVQAAGRLNEVEKKQTCECK